MKTRFPPQSGFTLVEVSVAASLLVMAVVVAIGALVYTLRGARQSDAQSDLDIDVQTAMERLKQDIRLTSLDKLFFSPSGPGPYTAISFPLAQDSDGDGAVDLDADGHIIWDQTVIYHAWSGNPNQLRKTIFSPRDNTLTAAQRQTQIDRVVADGNGSAAPNGANARTAVVFQNLFNWSIVPKGSTFDGYASSLTRKENVGLGSCVMSNGNHTFQFSIIGKHPSSSGYNLGIDSLFVSPCGAEREGEAQLPATASSGATPSAQYITGGSWDGSYQLLFPATAVGHSFTLTMANDRWEETNFRTSKETHWRTATIFDTSLSPYDYVVSLLGGWTWNWYASEQTGDAAGSAAATDALGGCAVRVLIRGDQMRAGQWIYYDGQKCYVNFRSGSGAAQKLRIVAAYIARCADSCDASMDTVPGSAYKLRFGGADGVTLNGSYWTDMANYPIATTNSYLVSFLIGDTAGEATPWQWRESRDSSMPCSYIIPATNSPTAADLLAASWSARGDVRTTNVLFGVYNLWTSYPSNGVYTSAIFDTGLSAPAYSRLDWAHNTPSGCGIKMKVRTGSSNDLSDAAAWSSIAPMTAPGTIGPGNRRYVQFQSLLQSDSYGDYTPKLKNVAVSWAGQTRIAEVGGTFTRGPDYGIFELRVDGQKLISGINVDLEIFKDVTGYRGTRRCTSQLSAEITPRNTGK